MATSNQRQVDISRGSVPEELLDDPSADPRLFPLLLLDSGSYLLTYESAHLISSANTSLI
jgi:hypothetical protein